MSDKDKQIADLTARVKSQARELAYTQSVLQRKTRELDALHYVWCSGGCNGGAHRWQETPLTWELVEIAERNTKRMRAWLASYEGRRDPSYAAYCRAVEAGTVKENLRAEQECALQTLADQAQELDMGYGDE